jgi:ATP-dependent metalloprotease
MILRISNANIRNNVIRSFKLHLNNNSAALSSTLAQRQSIISSTNSTLNSNCLQIQFKRQFASNATINKDNNTSTKSKSQTHKEAMQLLQHEADKHPWDARYQLLLYQQLIASNQRNEAQKRYEKGEYATNTIIDNLFRSEQNNDNNNNTQNQSKSQPIEPEFPAAFAQSQCQQSLQQGVHLDSSKGPIKVLMQSPRSKKSDRFKNTIQFIIILSAIYYFSLIVDELGPLLTQKDSIAQKSKNGELSKTRFSDVCGCDEAKQELQEIVEFLKHPDVFNK